MSKRKQKVPGWIKSTKGNAKIFVHPEITSAIVWNFNGVSFEGQPFDTVWAAATYAERKYIPDQVNIYDNREDPPKVTT